jgi:hypothetical protein
MEETLERWRSEKTASYLSAAVAAAEPDPGKAALFREMAGAAEAQAAILAKDLPEVPPFTPSLRSRVTTFLIRTFGPRAMRPVLSASKVRGVSVYSGKVQTGHSWPLPSRTWGAVTNRMAAARSGQGCSASMTGSCPTPASSWAWPAPPPSLPSSS